MNAIYESDKLLAEYLLFHYGTADEILPPGRRWPAGMLEALDFAIRTPGHFTPCQVRRGLDLGCAVGRSTFEMSRNCDEVLGIDFSHAFVRAAESIKDGGTISYERREEAAIATPLLAQLPTGIDTSKVLFQQGDAMDLSGTIGTFDRVHAANLLCRLGEPKRLLAKLPSLVNPSGELVIATPCTWLEEFTSRENWPQTDTLGWLRAELEGSFKLVAQADEPFLIRETARKFQWTTSLVTVWRRHA